MPMKGSAADATASDSGTSGGSGDKSTLPPKKRKEVAARLHSSTLSAELFPQFL